MDIKRASTVVLRNSQRTRYSRVLRKLRLKAFFVLINDQRTYVFRWMELVYHCSCTNLVNALNSNSRRPFTENIYGFFMF